MTVSEKYPYINQDCYKLDLNIKKIQDEITELNTKGDLSSGYLNSLHGYKTANQMAFDGKNCQNVIEYKRLNESADLITAKSIEQERKVLGASKTEQNIYIGVGALSLLVMLIIVIRK
jgi:hypothetical protein